MWLQPCTRDSQWVKYLKMVILEIPNVWFWSVFLQPITYMRITWCSPYSSAQWYIILTYSTLVTSSTIITRCCPFCTWVTLYTPFIAIATVMMTSCYLWTDKLPAIISTTTWRTFCCSNFVTIVSRRTVQTLVAAGLILITPWTTWCTGGAVLFTIVHIMNSLTVNTSNTLLYPPTLSH